jgi:hypothetical protein
VNLTPGREIHGRGCSTRPQRRMRPSHDPRMPGSAMDKAELLAAGPVGRKTQFGVVWMSLFLVVVFASSLFRIEDGDTWWHLKTGQLIRESFQVPRADPYSLLSPGKRWVDHEWLFQVLVHEIDAAFGVRGLVVFRAATVLLVFTVLFFYTRREGVPSEKALFLLSLAFVVARSRFFVRPEIVSFLLFALLLFTLLSPPKRPVVRYGLPILLMLVWANVHATCVYGVLAAFAIAAGELLAPAVREGPQAGAPGWPRFGRALRVFALPVAIFRPW